MAEITDNDLGPKYWTTTAAVREEFNLEIGNQEPDLERRIEQATRRMRAKVRDATGQDPPDQPPDLLNDATAYLAASLAHQAFAANISGENDGDQRHVFLEDMAMDVFDDWTASADIDPGDETDGSASDMVTGISGTINGSNPIERGDSY